MRKTDGRGGQIGGCGFSEGAARRLLTGNNPSRRATSENVLPGLELAEPILGAALIQKRLPLAFFEKMRVKF